MNAAFHYVFNIFAFYKKRLIFHILSDLPDPQFSIRPDPDLFVQIWPDPDLYFISRSGRIRILNVLSFM